MPFYHCFHTDLPDQFVEANADRLKSWVGNWPDNPYVIRSRIIDGVQVDLTGKQKRGNWPTLVCTSQRMLDLWMKNKGANHNGRYWGTLAEDQRDPLRVARSTARDDADDLASWWTGPGPIWSRTPTGPARSGRQSMSFTQWLAEREERPKPPLKRDGVVAGEIVGYRCWRLKDGLLKSVYQADVWAPGEILAGRELGDWDQRGIHAWKDAGSKQYHEYIRSYLNNYQDTFFSNAFLILGGGAGYREPRDPRPAMVTGTVFLWGDVVEHERGWRAEFARVRSLDWLYPDDKMMGREQEALDDLRRRYRLKPLHDVLRSDENTAHKT
jgi:hypothetical protein